MSVFDKAVAVVNVTPCSDAGSVDDDDDDNGGDTMR